MVWEKGIVVPRALMQGVMGLPRYHRHRPVNDDAEEPLHYPAPAAVVVTAGEGGGGFAPDGLVGFAVGALLASPCRSAGGTTG